ncbi:MAG: hypothetical protein LC122_12175 [Chitinophagales bacterium]|nr:hypothetical protein [Chitinophagales bacterium]
MESKNIEQKLGEPIFDLKEFLCKTICEIEKNGWVPKSKSDELNKLPTSLNVVNNYDDIEYSKEHKDKAINIINWIKELSDEDRKNNYLNNLFTIVESGFIQYKEINFAASIPSAYDNATKSAPESNHFGTIKEKVQLNIKFKNKYTFSNNFGMINIFVFVDNKNNIFTWKTNTYHEFEKDTYYTIKATIKSHDIYKGIKQTSLSYCKVI